MKNIKTIKIVSSFLALVSVAVNIATNILGEKILDNKIETKITEALAKNK